MPKVPEVPDSAEIRGVFLRHLTKGHVPKGAEVPARELTAANSNRTMTLGIF